MTCTGSYESLSWNNIVYTPLVEWQRVLSKLTSRGIYKGLSSKPDLYHRLATRQISSTTIRKPPPTGFLPSDADPSSKDVSRQGTKSTEELQATLSARRYVSSFKTTTSSLNSTQMTQPAPFNDNTMMINLAKENEKKHNDHNSRASMKHSSLSMSTSTTTHSSTSSPSAWKASLVHKAEGLKRRATPHDSSVAVSRSTDLLTSSNFTSTMAASTTSHPSSNSSLFAYGSTMAASNNVRQRALAETASNSLLITSERLKANTPLSMRPARQSSTSTMPSAYMTSQQLQRNASQPTRSRHQQDKPSNSKELYQYPDPFTNCPAEILSKLAQLTRLQMETVEWERKRRFTKKKPGTNGSAPGKDSP